MKIGVLALQGDFDAHRQMLERLGVDVVMVRKPGQLGEIDGLIIPGGESSTFLKLLGEAGFTELKKFVTTKPTFGTCAGAIMLAKEVENPSQQGTGAIDIRVRRNAYGRQIESTILTSDCSLPGGQMEMVYIRAPRIEEVGPGVEVLAKRDGHPVLVRQGNILAATFHPELTGDTRVHEEFLKLVRNGSAGEKS
jgi:5'-phosphate synthase pdxT subunit